MAGPGYDLPSFNKQNIFGVTSSCSGFHGCRGVVKADMLGLLAGWRAMEGHDGDAELF